MKKIYLLKMLVMVAFMQLIPSGLMAQNLKIFVASDLHYLDPELIINDGPALEAYLAMDRKMIRESEAIMDALVDTIMDIQPDIVLIPGDLTKDGELASHQKVAAYFQELELNGIEVYVIPGNHDVNNPHSFAYDGENVVPVPSVSPEDFSSIYNDFGYGQAIDKDPNSLSYTFEPVPGLMVFALDPCKYDQNYVIGHPETGGRFTVETYGWIMEKLAEAKSKNKRVIGMMHHGLIEHYSGQKMLFTDYVVDGWDTLSVQFADMGLKAMLTGHYHAQDAIELTTPAGNTIFDIETGSPVTYPSPFRVIDITANTEVELTSGNIEDIDYDMGGLDFQTYAYNYIAEGLPILVTYILTNPPYNLDEVTAAMVEPAITEAFIAHYAGNEGDPSPESQAVIEMLLSIPEYQAIGMALLAIWNDPAPNDHTFDFSLENGYRLTLLHNNDGESQLINLGGALENFGGVARFKSLVDSLKAEAVAQNSGVLMLSSGDNFLAGPEFSASLNLPEGEPYYDAIGMDYIGYDAVCIGNHDFDFGPDVLSRFILSYSMTQPPYLSANLDFALEDTLQNLVDQGRIAPSVVMNKLGEDIAVIGLTTPNLPFISSPRNVVVNDNIVNIVQDEVDALETGGVNKIILISHLQNIKEDSALITQIHGIDIAIAGGGDELLANPGDLLVPGDEGSIYGPYPLEITDAMGETVYVITGSGEYAYIGRLIVDFDEDGKVIGGSVTNVDLTSGPKRVANEPEEGGVPSNADVQAEVVDPVVDYVSGLASNVIGITEVDLDGRKPELRTRETNEGNLTADALLWQAMQLYEDFDLPAPDVAIQNGGGIRNNSIIPAGSDITELTTFDILPFPNFVTLIPEIPAEQFKEILENAVSKAEFVSGRFAQVAGFNFIWDPNGTPQELDENGEVVVPGTRVLNVTLDDGSVLVADGEVLPGAQSVNISTIDFLATGGDQYPYRGADYTKLGVSYQQSLMNYIVDELEGVITADQYPEGGEGRVIKYDGSNNAPEILAIIPDQSLLTGESFSFNLNDYFTDVDGDELLYLVSLPNGSKLPKWLKYNKETNELKGCPSYPATLTVKVKATDLIDGVLQEFNINVETANPMLTYLSEIKLGAFDEGAAEISAYDPNTFRLFVTNAEMNTLDIIDFSNPAEPVKIDAVDITTYGNGLQSVAVSNGIVATAIGVEPETDPGFVVFFDTDGNFINQLYVGSLPDMVTFTHDGSKLLVANEGEPNEEYTVDPEGTISIIDMTPGAANLTQDDVETADFTAFNDAGLDPSIRIFGPNATVAQDLEPEYIAISPENTTAFVTLQENNALAIVDIATATVTNLVGMGFKNHMMTGNGLDASNKSGGIDIKNWPVYGMFQPDAIDSYSIDGNTYYVTVNEGDARDYDGYSEEERVKDLDLDPEIFPNAEWLQENENLGRLKTTTANGDIDNDGLFEEIYSYGARSFTIWDENGNMVFDSQDDLEQITADYLPVNFNSTNDENDSFKNRSDDKGPEPEALKVAEINDRYYAFMGLERVGGIMVYDVTNPMFPEFVEYRNDRNFAINAEDDTTGHYAPEGIVFISAEDSPNGEALLVVSHEVSGTLAVYGVNADNATLPQTLTIMHNNDGESQLLESSYGPQWGGVGNFKFKVDSLRNEAYKKMSPSMMLSSGDNFLAGPEFSASLNLTPDQTYYDAMAMDHIGYDAVCIGNHDFDFGPDVLEKFIRDYSITQPPYLSANLDFSLEPGLQDLVDQGRISGKTVVNLNGTYVGVVGLTTPQLDYISSPRNVIVNDDLVNIAQAEIDALSDMGLNKIILISHLQSIKEDSALITQLHGIDIAIAGGGDELLTNDPSIALPGMEVYGAYPLEYEDAMGETVYVVTTPGEYTYVGHLMAEFDNDGKVISVHPASNPLLVTNTTPDPTLVETVEEPVAAYLENLAQNVIATTEVTLDGIKPHLRTQETNEGDLVADALLWQATELAPEFGVNIPQVALQNGGGIRNNSLIFAGSEISELTTFDILPFPNFVSVIEDIPPAQFKEILENAVSKVEFVSGRFAQVAGFEFVWDPEGTPQVIDEGIVTTPGTRVVEAKLADGTVIIENGLVAPDAPSINVATIDFLAKGGDQYPFGELEFTTLGVTYQQALYNFLTKDKLAVISAEDYPEGGNSRVVNMNQQTVNIPQGWSIISGYINPNNTTIEDIMQGPVNLDNLVIMLSKEGFYWPAQNLNTLINWNPMSGYKVKAEMGDYFNLDGNRAENMVFELEAGVNYLPVPTVHPVDAADIFGQVGEELIYAFDIYNGKIYWPQGMIFTLEELVPGDGYLVSMASAGNVDFSEAKTATPDAGQNAMMNLAAKNSPWESEVTGNYHLISILSSATDELVAGDVLAMFNQYDEFGGHTVVEQKDKNLVMVAFGDDPITESFEGLNENDVLTLKLYRPSTGETFDMEAEYNPVMPNTDMFTANGASMITDIEYKTTSSGNEFTSEELIIYPNPNQGVFNLLAKGVEGAIDVEVMNTQGQVIMTLSLDSNGMVETAFDISSYPYGIYFVKIRTKAQILTKKVIVK